MEIRYRKDLYKIVDLSLSGAELGVAEGNFSCDILDWGIERLYMVDAWENLNQTGDGGFPQEWHDKNFAMVQERIKKYNKDEKRAVILRGLTHEMANLIKDNSLGFINVDADHSYNGVMRDLKAWWPKLKAGGVMCMHDFQNPDYGVTQAVTDFFVPKGLKINILPEDSAADIGAYVIKK